MTIKFPARPQVPQRLKGLVSPSGERLSTKPPQPVTIMAWPVGLQHGIVSNREGNAAMLSLTFDTHPSRVPALLDEDAQLHKFAWHGRPIECISLAIPVDTVEDLFTSLLIARAKCRAWQRDHNIPVPKDDASAILMLVMEVLQDSRLTAAEACSRAAEIIMGSRPATPPEPVVEPS